MREDLHALDHRGDLELFADLPVDERFDVGVIQVEADHLGGAAGRAAALDRASGAVADLEEAHQADGLAATGEGLVLAAEAAEVGARAAAILEETGLARPEVHDAARVHEVVADGLDEAGVRLGVRVRIGAGGHLAGLGVAVRSDPGPGR